MSDQLKKLKELKDAYRVAQDVLFDIPKNSFAKADCKHAKEELEAFILKEFGKEILEQWQANDKKNRI